MYLIYGFTYLICGFTYLISGIGFTYLICGSTYHVSRSLLHKIPRHGSTVPRFNRVPQCSTYLIYGSGFSYLIYASTYLISGFGFPYLISGTTYHVSRSLLDKIPRHGSTTPRLYNPAVLHFHGPAVLQFHGRFHGRLHGTWSSSLHRRVALDRSILQMITFHPISNILQYLKTQIYNVLTYLQVLTRYIDVSAPSSQTTYVHCFVFEV